MQAPAIWANTLLVSVPQISAEPLQFHPLSDFGGIMAIRPENGYPALNVTTVVPDVVGGAVRIVQVCVRAARVMADLQRTPVITQLARNRRLRRRFFA